MLVKFGPAYQIGDELSSVKAWGEWISMHTIWCLARNWTIVVRRHCLLSSFFRSKSRLLGQWVMRALRFRQTVIVLNGHINTVGNLSLFFLFARILSDCGVSWFEITFYEIMSHYHICYPSETHCYSAMLIVLALEISVNWLQRSR